MDTKHYRRK